MPRPSVKLGSPACIMSQAAAMQSHSTTSSAKKEIGVLMLLLAAETVADCCVSPDQMLSTECVAAGRMDAGLLSLSREHGDSVALSFPPRNAVGFSPALSTTKLSRNRVVGTIDTIAASSVATDMSGCGVSYGDSSSSSAGDSDSTTPVPEPADDTLLMDLPPHVSIGLSKRFSGPGCAITYDAQTLERIVSYLGWREALRIRGVSRHWFEATLTRAVVCRLPSTRTPAIFLPCLTDFDNGRLEEEVEARLSRNPLLQVDAEAPAWKCEACGWENPSGLELPAESLALCGNRNCHSVAPQTTATQGPITRVFLGQLRREGTVPLVDWLMRDVLDAPHALLMVENHRHRITMRGKGCAWAYIQHHAALNDSENALTKLMSYHRRLFFDVVHGCVEGAWIAHPKDLAALAHDVETRSYHRDRPRYLPRNALVTELPAAQQLTALTCSDAANAVMEPSVEVAALSDSTESPMQHNIPASGAASPAPHGTVVAPPPPPPASSHHYVSSHYTHHPRHQAWAASYGDASAYRYYARVNRPRYYAAPCPPPEYAAYGRRRGQPCGRFDTYDDHAPGTMYHHQPSLLAAPTMHPATTVPAAAGGRRHNPYQPLVFGPSC